MGTVSQTHWHCYCGSGYQPWLSHKDRCNHYKRWDILLASMDGWVQTGLCWWWHGQCCKMVETLVRWLEDEEGKGSYLEKCWQTQSKNPLLIRTKVVTQPATQSFPHLHQLSSISIDHQKPLGLWSPNRRWIIFGIFIPTKCVVLLLS